MTVVQVWLWGTLIGAAADNDDGQTSFQYSPDFATSGIEVSPIVMPLRKQTYEFPHLSKETFKGLPGLLADALPDRFGNALINAWLQRQGRAPSTFTPLERLCYLGSRGMGALEFRPATGPSSGPSEALHVEALVQLASDVLRNRSELGGSLAADQRDAALASILHVGTSAGGARAKAVISWNEETNEVRSGQGDTDPGFGQWLLKFDGVEQNRDKESADESGFGAIEYAYSLLAAKAGVVMMPCRLLREATRAHFMTRRFDRTDGGRKLHMQSLGSLVHADFNVAGSYSYEEAAEVLRTLRAPASDREQLVRRAILNIVLRNQDDHVKNIAFLMDRSGQWTLSPAYDVTFSYNPDGQWTSAHHMTLNGKRDGFTLDDLRAYGKDAGLPRGRVDRILRDVLSASALWPRYAVEVGVGRTWIDHIAGQFRTDW